MGWIAGGVLTLSVRYGAPSFNMRGHAAGRLSQGAATTGPENEQLLWDDHHAISRQVDSAGLNLLEFSELLRSQVRKNENGILPLRSTAVQPSCPLGLPLDGTCSLAPGLPSITSRSAGSTARPTSSSSLPVSAGPRAYASCSTWYRTARRISLPSRRHTQSGRPTGTPTATRRCTRGIAMSRCTNAEWKTTLLIGRTSGSPPAGLPELHSGMVNRMKPKDTQLCVVPAHRHRGTCGELAAVSWPHRSGTLQRIRPAAELE